MLQGVGKTLIAKAIATEANIPFFSADGSAFVKIFVGQGASKVRDLFDKARKVAPCIVFIDELDAVAGSRKNAINSNDEREQTLNQILIEMDGFKSKLDKNKPVIVIGATNRVDMLDEAILRPGRFDRIIRVGLPNKKARKAIFKVHSKNKSIAADVNFNDIVSQTAGNSGADIANIMNEAAIIALRKNSTVIQKEHINEAFDKTTIGQPLYDIERSYVEDLLISVHEIGHALTSLLLDHNKVSRVSITPTVRDIGGVTIIIPKDEGSLDQGIVSKTYLLNELKVLLGGRIAEEIMFGNENITTGASSDLARAKELVKQYLDDFCMDGDFGYEYEKKIHIVLQDNYIKTYKLLEENKLLLELMANELIKKRTLYEDELIGLFNATYNII